MYIQSIVIYLTGILQPFPLKMTPFEFRHDAINEKTLQRERAVMQLVYLRRDYNCDSATIRLRSDYDVSRAPASNSTQAKNEHVNFSS